MKYHRNLFILLTVVFMIAIYTLSANAYDSGYDSRAAQRENKANLAYSIYLTAKDKYNLYYNKSTNVKEIENSYNNMKNAYSNYISALKGLAPYFSCYEKESSNGVVTISNFPYNLYLHDDSEYYDCLDWYIMTPGSGKWIWFSNEKDPVCEIWNEGKTAIKLVKNGDANNYMIREFTFSITTFDIINPYNGTYNYLSSLPGGIYPPEAKLVNHSSGLITASWYVWDYENGCWSWVSNEKSPQIKVWQTDGDGFADVKLVKNGNPNNYCIKTIYVDKPHFNINVNGQNATDGLYNVSLLPLTINLNPMLSDGYGDEYTPGDIIRTLDWYIWDVEKSSWVWFSNELKPNCSIWHKGESSIKMIKNSDSNNYVIHTITVY